MRPCRNQLIVLVVVAAAIDTQVASAAVAANLFPLATGNFWRYRCGVEASGSFEKSLRLSSRMRSGEFDGWSVELRSAGRRSHGFIWRSRDGVVRTGPRPGASGDIIGTTAASEGSVVGTRTYTRERKRRDLASFGRIWRAEAYPLSPDLDENRQLGWSATWYAENLGPVAEGDGGGGGCRLVSWSVGGRVHRSR